MNIGDTRTLTFEQVIQHLLQSDLDIPDKAGYLFYPARVDPQGNSKDFSFNAVIIRRVK